MINIAIFASGAGSNARQIIAHFHQHPTIRVALILCNKQEAGVYKVADEAGIPIWHIEKEPFFRGNAYVPELQQASIDYLVLAGFLWKIPKNLIDAFPNKIINIHPALLPKFGGKGMYGQFVHQAVLESGESVSGITIHLVDEHYDHGSTLFQVKCSVEKTDSPETLAQKIHALEHFHYPRVIEDYIQTNRSQQS